MKCNTQCVSFNLFCWWFCLVLFVFLFYFGLVWILGISFFFGFWFCLILVFVCFLWAWGVFAVVLGQFFFLLFVWLWLLFVGGKHTTSIYPGIFSALQHQDQISFNINAYFCLSES